MDVDGDQLWLLNCLNATLDFNQHVRSSAEECLRQAATQPGYGVALAKVTINKEIPVGLRQLAAVILKQYVKQHWQEGEENYTPPTVPPAEKKVIRNLLLQSLDDPHRKICTAVSMAVASIAKFDWPENWPELITVILSMISNQTNMNGVRGALKCIALLSGDFDDNILPRMLPVLFPSLLTIVSSPNIYDPSMRIRAMSIVYSCLATLGVMRGVFEKETREVLKPLLHSWLEQFSTILGTPVSSENPDDWCLRLEVLKSISQLVQSFPELIISDFPVIMESIWQTFVSCLKVYEIASIQGVHDSYAGRTDSDGGDQSLEGFVIQMFELLLTLVANKFFSKGIRKYMTELMYYSIGYMQITESQAESWFSDVNQYVSDEDEMQYSCRVSGILLLEEIFTSYKSAGLVSFVDAAKKRLEEAHQAKVDGNSDWWKLREASVLAIGSLSDQLLETELIKTRTFNLETFLDDLFIQDIGEGGAIFPFLQARGLWAISKFSTSVNKERLQQFVYAAARALATDVSPPVKVGACKALSHLLPRANADLLHPYMSNVFSSLATLLKQANDETLHLVLDTLQAAIKADEKTSLVAESFISPLVLNIWAQNVFDPFISIDCVEVLEAIKNVPGCFIPLISRVLPTISPILANPHQQPAGLVSGTLDLVTMFLKNSSPDAVKVICDACFDSVILIILHSTDHSELQNATECLSAFVLWGKCVLLSAGSENNPAVKMLLDAAARLLNPEMESSGSLFVGSYILQLILHLPSYIAMHINDLVRALIRRMETSEILGLKNSLLLVLARLIHMCSSNIEQLIDLLISIPKEGYENSLHYLMSEWTKQQGDIHGAYQIKVTVTALCLLLGSKHSELFKIRVLGRLVQSNACGIITRAKSKKTPDQWTEMGLPSKILSLLAEMLIEFQEQNGIDDEEDEWEEVDGDDDIDLANLANSITDQKLTENDMNAMRNMLNKGEDDTFEDDPLILADPLNQIEAASFIINFLQTTFGRDKAFLDFLWQDLTERERNVLETSMAKFATTLPV